MKKGNKLTFVLSDESVNSHGTWVKTSGIDLKRFKSNPVMLWSHDDSFPPIGRWENIRVEDDKLLADAMFDESDELAMALKRKVEEGIIKSCSIGFIAKRYSSAIEDIKPGQIWETIVESEVVEASLCAVGANANAMRLYNSKGELIELSNEMGRQMSGMKRLKENIITDTVMTEQELKLLQEELEQLKAYKAQKEKEDIERREQEIDALISHALEAGKIKKSNEQVWRCLAEKDFESTKIALEAIEVPVKLSRLAQPARDASQGVKSWRELDKEGKLEELKRTDIEQFKALYKQEFGVDYIG